MKQFTITLTLIALLLGGCATDSNTTRAQGAGFGALLGAGIGALIGDEKGAMIGAAVGGVAGLAYGDHVAKKKEKYASEEDYLDACTQVAQERYQENKKYNDSLKTEIAAITAELNQIGDVASATKDDHKRLEKLQKALKKSIENSESQLTALNEEIVMQREAIAQVDPAQQANTDNIKALNDQIALLEQQKAELQANTQQLASLSARASA